MREAHQSPGEELANTVTHGIGAALATAALVVLVVFASLRGDAWRIVSLSVYGATLVLLYSASTLFHGFRHPRIKKYFRTMDHSAIYLLIAGTYTPVTLVQMRGGWGWTLFGLIWGLAILGIAATVLLSGRWRAIGVALYLVMGWLALIAIRPMLQMLPTGLIVWLVLGGICYTVGVVFYRMHSVRYHHALWHLFVLAGSICHFIGLLLHNTVAPGR
jgi:hemolysin III